MKHNFEHYLSKFLTAAWWVILVVGSGNIVLWVTKLLLRLIGVI